MQPNQDELEAEVDKLRRKQEQSRRAARGETVHTASNTPNASTPPSRSGSPSKDGGGDHGEKSSNGTHHKREKIEYENGTNR